MVLAKIKKNIYILVIHVLEELNLSQGPFGVDDVVKSVTDLLDSYFLSCL